MVTTKAKIFESDSIKTLQDEINEFIEDVEVVSLSLSSYTDETGNVFHNAALVYRYDDTYDKHIATEYINRQQD